MAKNNKLKCVMAAMLASLITVSSGATTVAFAAEGTTEPVLVEDSTGEDNGFTGSEDTTPPAEEQTEETTEDIPDETPEEVPDETPAEEPAETPAEDTSTDTTENTDTTKPVQDTAVQKQEQAVYGVAPIAEEETGYTYNEETNTYHVTTFGGLTTVLGLGGNIVLDKDLVKEDPDQETQVPAGVKAVLDLNGKTITLGSAITGITYYMISVYGELTVKDSVGSGTMNSVNALNSLGTIDCHGGKLTIESGIYTVGDIVNPNILSADSGTVEIKGGTFNGAVNSANGGTMKITGGTFASDPTAHVESGYSVADNGNGTWTVIKGYTGECGDNVSFSFDTTTGTLTISGTGAMADYQSEGTDAPWYNERDDIKSVVIGSGVTSIGNYAFAGMNDLASVDISASVETIGKYAFKGSKLSSVTIPSGVKNIGERAFCYCSSLTTVTMEREVPPSLGVKVFISTSAELKIKVPIQYLSSYQTATNWSEYKDKMESYGIGGTCGENAYWALDEETGVLTISGTGAMADYASNDAAPWKDYAAQITAVNVESGITSIGSRAFSDCENLKTITLPQSVTSIGDWAFAWTALEAIDLPDGLTAIGSSAFHFCRSLTSAAIPDDVTVINEQTFNGCTSLASVTLPANLQSIAQNAFNSTAITSVEIPAGVTFIGNSAFSSCTSLTEVTFAKDSKLETIDSQAFRDTAIPSITIPAGVTEIGANAFNGCTKLAEITMKGAVPALGENAFQNCTSLTTINVPGQHLSSYETAAGWSAYAALLVPGAIGGNCGATESDSVEWKFDPTTNTLTISGTGAIADYEYNSAAESTVPWAAYKDSIKSVVIEEGITSIGECAFSWHTSLESVSIAASVLDIEHAAFQHSQQLNSVTFAPGSQLRTISPNAFHSCSGLTAITLPDGLQGILISAFAYTGLDSITIPASVKTIGSSAFQNTYLTDVIMEGTVAPALGTYVFVDYKNNLLTSVKIHVPVQYLNDYKTAENWSDYADQMVPYGIGGICGENAIWYIDEETGKLTITGTGAMYDYGYDDSNKAPWSDYRNDIKSLEIEDGITAIGQYAFRFLPGLTSVEIPASVVTIDEGAFDVCRNLETVTFAEGSVLTAINDYAFMNCDNLKSIEIPATVTTIGVQAFAGCENQLTEITLPADLQTLEDQAFQGCSSLTAIEIPAGIQSIGLHTFEYCDALTSVTFAEDSKLTSIGNYAFSNTGLTSITIPSDVTTIGEGAFSNCTSLKTVTFEEDSKLNTIGNYAFESTDLEKVTIPSSVSSIGDGAFRLCDKLEEVTMLGEKPWLDENAFIAGIDVTTEEKVIVLKRINVPAQYYTVYKTADDWSDYADLMVPYGKVSGTCGDTATWELDLDTGVLTIGGTGAMANYEYDTVTGFTAPWAAYKDFIQSAVIKEGITYIGEYAFYECDALTGITLPSSIESMGSNTFYGCGSLATADLSAATAMTAIPVLAFSQCGALQTVVLPESIQTIGNKAFYYCDKLENINLSDGLTTIGEQAFCYCDGLKKLEIPSTVRSIGNKAFATQEVIWDRELIMHGTAPSLGSEAFFVYGQPKEYPPNITVPGAYYNGYVAEGSSWAAYANNIIAPDHLKFATVTGVQDSYAWTGKEIKPILTVTTHNGVPLVEGTHYYVGYSNNKDPGTATISLTAYVPSNFYGQKTIEFEILKPAGQCGENAYWELETATGKLTITGTGAMYDYESLGDVPWNSYVNYITEVEIPDGITAIGDHAFALIDATEIAVPDSVQTIGDHAFANSLLQTITFGPESQLAAIIDGAFYNTQITSIEIPVGVTTIGEYAFTGCYQLEEITIPDSVAFIGDAAFKDCYALTEIRIPEGVQAIGTETFYYCTELTKVEIPASVKTIGESAFEDCNRLTAVQFGENSELTAIGVLAFSGCESLESIDLPDSLEEIANEAFMECGLTSITLPSSLKTIGINAFLECGFTSITIPDSVTTIGDFAFKGCCDLTEVSFGASSALQQIGVGVFALCGLSEITIPSGVASIGGAAFYGCQNLKEVTMLPTAAPALPDIPEEYGLGNIGAFEECPADLVIVAPINSTGYEEGKWADLNVKYNLADVTVEAIADQPWTGGTVKPSAAVKVGETTLTENTHYTVAYGENTAIGKGTVTITAADGSEYFGSKTVEFNIVAPSGQCGEEAYWKFDPNSGKLTITGTGAMYDYANNDGKQMPWYDLCENITSVAVEDGITSIGNLAFAFSPNLTSVTLPEGVTVIGMDAFSRCTKLATLTIPESVETIGDFAFANSGITELNMTGNAPETVGENAFFGAEDLTVYVSGAEAGSYTGGAWENVDVVYVDKINDSGVTLNKDSYDYYGEDYDFDLTVKNWDGTKTLTPGTDYEVTYTHDLTAKTGTVTVKGIGTYGGEVTKNFTIDNVYYGQCGETATWKFDPATGKLTITGTGTMADYHPNDYGQFGLEEATFAPWGNYNVKSVVISGSVTSIGAGAFYFQNTLTSVTIPESVTSIGKEAFYSCTVLTSIDIPASVTTIDENAFYGCDVLNTVNFAANSTLTVIPESAFSWCEKLTSITIPASVTELGRGAFAQTGLTEIKFEEGSALTTIGDLAFFNCASLTEVTIPAGVVSISYNVFDQSSVITVNMTGDAPTDVDAGAFDGAKETLTVYVSGAEAGGYTGGAWENVDVVYVDKINDSGVTLNKDSYDYIGEDYDFDLTVKNWDGTKTLTPGTDYEVTYTHDLTAKTGTVTVKGIGTYGGEVTKNFTIDNVYYGQCGENAYWKLNPATGKFTVIGTGAMYDIEIVNGISTRPWDAYKDLVNSVEIGEGITYIGSSAFHNYDALTSVSLPTTLRSIGSGAFNQVPLTELELPSGLESIGSHAFFAAKFKEVVIPDSVTEIGSMAFAYCKDMTSVTLPDNENFTMISSALFYECSALTEVTIPASVTQIQWDVFNKSGVTTINMTGNAPKDVFDNVFAGAAEGLTVYVSGKDASGYTGGVWENVDVVYVDQLTSVEAIAEQTYTGSELKPAVAVKNYKGETLTAGTDYTVEYSDNVNAGTAAVTITGAGAYGGKLTQTFTIAPADISKAVIGGLEEKYLYNYEEQTPLVTVTFGETELTEGTDYEVAYSNNRGIGTATVTVTGKGNYKGEVTDTFEIYLPMSEGATDSYLYGKCGDNAFWILDNNYVVTVSGSGPMWDIEFGTAGWAYSEEARDRIVGVDIRDGITRVGNKAFHMCRNAAEVKLADTVTSIGDLAFYGNTSLTEIDLPKNLTTIGTGAFADSGLTEVVIPESVESIGDAAFLGALNLQRAEFTGDAPEMGMGVFNEDENLTVYVYGKDASGYTGEAWENVKVVYVDQLTSVEAIADHNYTGKAYTPAVVVKNWKGEVIDASDYTVEYSDNVNAGTATVTITGTGETYGGKLTTAFEINPRLADNLTVSVAGPFTYTGEAIEPDVTVMDGEIVLQEGVDYTVAYDNNVNADGLAVVGITCIGNYEGTVHKPFSIDPKSLLDDTIEIGGLEDVVYNGQEQKLPVTITDGERTLTEGVDYEVQSYSNDATNTGTVEVVIAGMGNYGETVIKHYKILPKQLEAKVQPENKIYDGTTNAEGSLMLDGIILGDDISVSAASMHFADADAGEGKVVTAAGLTLSGADAGNYVLANKTAAGIGTIAPKAVTVTADAISKTYGDADPALTYKADGLLGEDALTGTLVRAEGENAGSYAIAQGTLAANANYTIHFTGAELTINPKVLGADTVISNLDDKIYTGAAHTQSGYAVMDGAHLLTEGVDYEVSYKDNINVGTASMVVTGKGNYSGTAVKNFNITIELSEGAEEAVDYGTCGDEMTWVVDNTGTLIVDGSGSMDSFEEDKAPWADSAEDVKDIVVKDGVTEIGDNAFAGTGAETVDIPDSVEKIGDNAFANADNLTEIIVPDSVDEIGSGAFAGSDNLEEIRFSGNAPTIADDAFDGTDATIVVSGKDSTGYEGGAWDNVEVVYIHKMSSVKIAAIADHTYTGSEITPELMITSYDGETLVKNEDYIVSYGSDSDDGTAPAAASYKNNVNVGTATVIVAGIGDYSGTTTAYFTITPKPFSEATAVSGLTDKTYTGAAQTHDLTVKDGGIVLTEGRDYTVAYSNHVNVGTATVTITAKGNYTGVVKKTFKVAPKALGRETVINGQADQVYTGSAHTPEITVRDGKTALVEGRDYTVSYKNNTYVGMAQVIVTGKGNYTGTASVDFEIYEQTTAIFRLYNPNSGEHFYTCSVEERDNLIAEGWIFEGITGNAPVSTGTPVHRLYNPVAGDHHYSMSQEEIDNLVAMGWIYEGIAWNSAAPTEKNIPMYRLYNPNAVSGSHHYTNSQEEIDLLVSAGWQFEGIGWYVSAK